MTKILYYMFISFKLDITVIIYFSSYISSLVATSLFAIWNEALGEKYNYFQRHQDNIIYFRLTIAFWIACIIFGVGSSVYFYNNVGKRKRRDRESMFSNCIEQDSPIRTSSPVAQQGNYLIVLIKGIFIISLKIIEK